MVKEQKQSRTRLYSVASDAVEKLQNMVKGGKFSRMPYTEVEMFLEKAVYDAVQQKQYELINDCTDRASPREGLLVTLPATVGKGMHAVVHDDRAYRPGKPRQIILAVLDASMVEFNRQNGNWSTRNEPLRPMVNIGSKMPQDKLKALLEESQKRTELPPQLVSPPKFDPPPRMTIEQAKEEVFRYKVTWGDDQDSGNPQSAEPDILEKIFTKKEDMTTFVSDLVATGGVDDVRIFKEVLVPTWVEMKKKVRVDIE